MFFNKIKHLIFFVFYFLSFSLSMCAFAKAEAVSVDDILKDIIGVEDQREPEQAKPVKQPVVKETKPEVTTPQEEEKVVVKQIATSKVKVEATDEDVKKRIFTSIVSAKVIDISDDATTQELQRSSVMPEDVRQFLGNHTRSIYLSLEIPNFDNNLEEYKKNSLENFRSISNDNMDEYQSFFVHKMYDVPFIYLNDAEKESLDLFLNAYAQDLGGIKTVIIYTRSYMSNLNEDFNSVKGYLNTIYIHWLKSYILEQLGSIARVVVIRMDNIPYNRVFLKLGNVKIESHKIRNIYNSDLITIEQWMYNNDIMERIAIDEKNVIYKRFEEIKKREKAQEDEENGIMF